MPDCMSFPDNIMDFIDDYSFEDSDHVYTNGSKLIPSFRVKQAVEYYFREEPVKPELRMTKYGFKQWIVCGSCYGKIYGGDDYCRHCGKKVKWE